jgi:hypothetical protein
MPGRLVKNTFRGSDAIFPKRPQEFLVIMSDTDELEGGDRNQAPEGQCRTPEHR